METSVRLQNNDAEKTAISIPSIITSDMFMLACKIEGASFLSDFSVTHMI